MKESYFRPVVVYEILVLLIIIGGLRKYGKVWIFNMGQKVRDIKPFILNETPKF